jgi:ASC-1-like (ASCH) protein
MKDMSLKEYGKKCFKQMLEEKHQNIKYGDTLTFGIQFLDEQGNVLTDYDFIETIHKDEL